MMKNYVDLNLGHCKIRFFIENFFIKIIYNFYFFYNFIFYFFLNLLDFKGICVVKGETDNFLL